MVGRVYRAPMNQLALGVNKQDLWAITTSANVPFWLEEIRLDPIATSVAEYLLSLRLFTGAYSSVTSGSTNTPAKTQPNDAASTSVLRLGSTGQTSTAGGGTNLLLDAGQWNLVNGWVWQPIDPDHRIAVPLSAAIVLSLDTVPSAASVNGCAIFREMF